MNQRRGLGAHRAYVALLIAAFMVRAVVVMSTDPMKVLSRWSNVGDATLYDTFGRNVALEGVLGVGAQPSGFVLPAYPVFVGGVYKVFGAVPGAVRWSQAVLSVLTIMLLGRLARRLAGQRAQLVVVLCASFYPFLVYFVPEILTETLFIFCFSAMMTTSADIGSTGRLRDGIFHGLALAVGCMTRPVALIMEPGILLLSRPWERTGRARRLSALGVAMAILGVAWGTWVVRNFRVFDEVVLFDTHGGYTLYTSQLIARGLSHREVVERTQRELGYYRYDIERGTLPGGPHAELENDRRAAIKARELMSQGRWLMARLAVRNIYHLWANLDFTEVEHRASGVGLAGIVGWIAYVAVLIPGFWGLVELVRAKRFDVVLAFGWVLLATTALFALTHGGKRYRVATIDPVLIVAAGIAASSRRLPWGTGDPATLRTSGEAED